MERGSFAEGKNPAQEVKLSDIDVIRMQIENAKVLTSDVYALSAEIYRL
jgi:hypothetical protein